MSWLSAYYSARGYEVTGSDLTTGGHCASNVHGADLVVYTSAVSPYNEELTEAKRLGIPTVTRAELLGDVSRAFDNVIAVAGTHGKTTVTGMLAAALPEAAAHLGGTLGGKIGKVTGDLLICEACEYKKSFLTLKRNIAVVLNAEMDHPDFYRDKKAVLEAFAEFSAQSDILVTSTALADVLTAKSRIITVGEGGDCRVETYKAGRYVGLSLWGRKIAFSTQVIGKHNALNFAFAAVAAALVGKADDEIAYELSRFKGIDRRLECVGMLSKARLISDYAHHPREISASIDAVRSGGSPRILTVFQPHTFSRLAALLGGFVKSLRKSDTLILPVFAARETDGERNSIDLYRALKSTGATTRYVGSFEEAADTVKRVAERYDAVIIMGAGDINKLIPMILK